MRFFFFTSFRLCINFDSEKNFVTLTFNIQPIKIKLNLKEAEKYHWLILVMTTAMACRMAMFCHVYVTQWINWWLRAKIHAFQFHQLLIMSVIQFLWEITVWLWTNSEYPLQKNKMYLQKKINKLFRIHLLKRFEFDLSLKLCDISKRKIMIGNRRHHTIKNRIFNLCMEIFLWMFFVV